MSDVIEPLGLMEIFVDGFEEHELQGHNVSCLGFRNTKAGKIAVVRLTFPASAVHSAIQEAKAAVADENPSPIGLRGAVTSKLPN